MVTHAAIRQGNGVQTVEDTMTVAEMRAALDAARSLDMIPHEPDPTPPERDSDKRHVRAVD